MLKPKHTRDLLLLTSKSTHGAIKTANQCLSSLPLSLLHATVPLTSKKLRMIKTPTTIVLVPRLPLLAHAGLTYRENAFLVLKSGFGSNTQLLLTASWEEFNDFGNPEYLFSFLSSRHLRGLLYLWYCGNRGRALQDSQIVTIFFQHIILSLRVPWAHLFVFHKTETATQQGKGTFSFPPL